METEIKRQKSENGRRKGEDKSKEKQKEVERITAKFF